MSEFIVLDVGEARRLNDKYRLAVEKISEFGTKFGKLNGLLMMALQHLEYYQEVDGGCDHSVGICSCELREVIRAIKEELGE